MFDDRESSAVVNGAFVLIFWFTIFICFSSSINIISTLLLSWVFGINFLIPVLTTVADVFSSFTFSTAFMALRHRCASMRRCSHVGQLFFFSFTLSLFVCKTIVI